MERTSECCGTLACYGAVVVVRCISRLFERRFSFSRPGPLVSERTVSTLLDPHLDGLPLLDPGDVFPNTSIIPLDHPQIKVSSETSLMSLPSSTK